MMMRSTETSRERRWRSKKDPLLVGAIVLGVTGCLGLALYTGARGERYLLAAAGFAISGVLPLILFLPIRYALDDELLRIRSGFFRWRIPLPLILDARPSDRGVGPALSFERVAISYRTPNGAERVVISPARRDEFLRALREAAPAATVPECGG